MREIKFRAWSIKEKIMKNRVVVGCDFEFDSYKTFVYESKPFKNSINSYPNENLIPIQFTGLKDKNGVEIYEGDILKLTNENEAYKHKDYKFKYLTVKWWEYGFFLFDEKDRKRYSCNKEIISSFGLEIVGNIYENKYLLKGENNGSI